MLLDGTSIADIGAAFSLPTDRVHQRVRRMLCEPRLEISSAVA